MEHITIKGLNKAYISASKKVEVLKGIDLTIMKGETIAVLGASGAGKSTLLNIMGTLDRPTSGDVFYGAESIFGMDNVRLASFRNRYIGFVFQFHHLLPEFTAIENVMMPAFISGSPQKESYARAAALLQEVGLGHRLDHKPGELSGGEQQRAAIVRSLMQNPEVVLADEPTGNLDARTGEEIFDLLLALNAARGTTMVIVTHNEKLASKLSRKVEMTDGCIREIL